MNFGQIVQTLVAFLALLMTISVLVRYVARDRDESNLLFKMGFGLREFFSGTMADPGKGANIHTSYGFRAEMNEGELVKFQPTQTISREL